MPGDYQPSKVGRDALTHFLWVVRTNKTTGQVWARTAEQARERVERRGHEVRDVFPVLRHRP